MLEKNSERSATPRGILKVFMLEKQFSRSVHTKGQPASARFFLEISGPLEAHGILGHHSRPLKIYFAINMTWLTVLFMSH